MAVTTAESTDCACGSLRCRRDRSRRRAGRRAGCRCRARSRRAAVVAHDGGDDELGLALPASVERGLGRLRAGGDGVHREQVVADLGEHLEGRVEDLRLALALHAGAGAGLGRGHVVLLGRRASMMKRNGFVLQRHGRQIHSDGTSRFIRSRPTGSAAGCRTRPADCAHEHVRAARPRGHRREAWSPPHPRRASVTGRSASRSTTPAGATTCSTTRRCRTPTSTSGCASSSRWRTASPSSAPPTRRPRRSVERCPPSSPRSTTSRGWRASTTRSPTTSSRGGTPDCSARASRRPTCCASSRSTASRSTSSTRTAGWCARSPGVTAAPARTSRPTSRRSTPCPTG